MIILYCIAIESEASGAIYWFDKEEDRDLFMLDAPVTAGDRVSIFTTNVPDNATPEEKMLAADDAMWHQTYTPDMRYIVRKPTILTHAEGA